MDTMEIICVVLWTITGLINLFGYKRIPKMNYLSAWLCLMIFMLCNFLTLPV